VTVLIGLSYKKKPEAGIIGTPYKQKGDKKVYEPVVTVGSVQEKETIDFNGNQWKNKIKTAPRNPIIMATSNSRRSKS
jgi:3'-phosphoadenosine 5'-phosphosulfate (PAPS) 3'-phosphatase